MNSPLKVFSIPALEDNYIYIIHNRSTDDCVVIDPGVSKPILDFFKQHPFKLKEIWITHWHSDHIGGCEELKEETHCEIVGPEKEADKIPGIDKTVSDLDIIEFGDSKAKVFEVPGHTLGHIVYWFFNDHLLFCGDTLFSLGCGRLFEGSAEQMWHSLCKIRALPSETKVYCGHEYTLKNAKFALSIDPDNEDLKKYAQEVEKKRKDGKPTVPFILKGELLTNPFLRADLPTRANQEILKGKNSIEIFDKLRTEKDNFS